MSVSVLVKESERVCLFLCVGGERESVCVVIAKESDRRTKRELCCNCHMETQKFSSEDFFSQKSFSS